MDRDRELIAYLDNQFAKIGARFEGIDAKFEGIDAKFEGIDARFEGIDARFEGIDARLEELKDQMDHRFETLQDQTDRRFETLQDQTDRRFETLQDQTDRRFDQTQGQIRRVHVAVEDLHCKVQIVAEGYAALDEKIDRYHQASRVGRREDRTHIEAVMKAMYVNLSRRDDDLEERIERLETA